MTTPSAAEIWGEYPISAGFLAPRISPCRDPDERCDARVIYPNVPAKSEIVRPMDCKRLSRNIKQREHMSDRNRVVFGLSGSPRECR
ncbi:hypothetical protein ABH922_001808 [Rhodococcus sp. 27YEA15]